MILASLAMLLAGSLLAAGAVLSTLHLRAPVLSDEVVGLAVLLAALVLNWPSAVPLSGGILLAGVAAVLVVSGPAALAPVLGLAAFLACEFGFASLERAHPAGEPGWVLASQGLRLAAMSVLGVGTGLLVLVVGAVNFAGGLYLTALGAMAAVVAIALVVTGSRRVRGPRPPRPVSRLGRGRVTLR